MSIEGMNSFLQYQGIAVAPCLAEAPAVRYCKQVLTYDCQCDYDVEKEKARLQIARHAARIELLVLAEKVASEASPQEGEVFEAQAMIVEDTALTEPLKELLHCS